MLFDFYYYVFFCISLSQYVFAENIGELLPTTTIENEIYSVEEEFENSNIDPVCGSWGLFDPVTMIVSGLYERTSVSDYVNLLKSGVSAGDVVILKDGVIQTSGYLEEGMIVRCYDGKGQILDYVIAEVLPLPDAPGISLNTQTNLGETISYTTTSTSNPYGFTLPLDNMNLSSHITSPFGYHYHPISGVYKLHKGIDISWGGISGTPVKAVSSGTVTVGWDDDGYGNYVTINHGSINGESLKTLYAHMSSVAVSSGQTVVKGQIIGYVGSTGGSTGPHLHFEVRTGAGEFFNCTPVDPIPYLTNSGNAGTVMPGNLFGNYDSASGSPGTVSIYGWAFDNDEPSTAIDIHVYIGGVAGSSDAIGYDMGATNILRSDVNSTYGISGNHGFDFTISTSKQGTQEVYVYAINLGNGENTSLGQITVDIS